MKIALVLGAGGTVGMAYHVGVLRALVHESGLDPTQCDLIVGTSAGSVIGAYLRCGLPLEEMWNQAFGEGKSSSQADSENSVSQIFAPAFHNPVDLIQHILGSAFVLARSAIRVPIPTIPRFLRHAFPGGMFSLGEGRQRLEHDLPHEWPDKPLWLCAVDIVSGHRVVLGRDKPDSGSSLLKAVMASCAIPGVYPPVRIGDRILVDGGVHSTTNMDLVLASKCDLVIGVAPMAFDTEDHSLLSIKKIVRRPPAITLAHELAQVRESGATVLLLRPNADEVNKHGFNMMRRAGLDSVATLAYETTLEKLRTDRFAKALAKIS